MSPRNISEHLRQVVQMRAAGRCEYCLTPAEVSFYAFEIDHVIARKHGGETIADNLAFACWRCNRHKGTDLTSFDPLTNTLTQLYNPRIDSWPEHFKLVKAEIVGCSAQGRATIRILQLNSPDRVVERQRLIAAGYFSAPDPPSTQ